MDGGGLCFEWALGNDFWKTSWSLLGEVTDEEDEENPDRKLNKSVKA
jgi:hypothetical protein